MGAFNVDLSKIKWQDTVKFGPWGKSIILAFDAAVL